MTTTTTPMTKSCTRSSRRVKTGLVFDKYDEHGDDDGLSYQRELLLYDAHGRPQENIIHS